MHPLHPLIAKTQNIRPRAPHRLFHSNLRAGPETGVACCFTCKRRRVLTATTRACTCVCSSCHQNMFLLSPEQDGGVYGEKGRETFTMLFPLSLAPPSLQYRPLNQSATVAPYPFPPASLLACLPTSLPRAMSCRKNRMITTHQNSREHRRKCEEGRLEPSRCVCVCVRSCVRACVRACCRWRAGSLTAGSRTGSASVLCPSKPGPPMCVCSRACVRACVFPFENSRPLENSFSNGLGQCSTATAAPASRHYRGCTEV